ncbi:MAG TPA: PIG-L deacetylase family protein [Patescibacteria group bacterium]|nr:PIG-L deacetylase family protein [Patescibacteria group bacterium]
MQPTPTTDAYAKIFSDKKTVMVVMAHPDDLEVFCGGTVARLVADGKTVISVKLTSGNRGSKDTEVSLDALARQRLAEDANSMAVFGIPPERSVNLLINDGEVENSLEVIGKIAFLIRKFQPELIITANPENVIVRHSEGTNWVNHRDHRLTATSALDAAYPYSRDRSFFPQHFNDSSLRPANCTEFLIADSWTGVDEVLIDVANFIGTAKKAMLCHTSQVDAAYVKNSVEFFTTHDNTNGVHEKFRYVIAD